MQGIYERHMGWKRSCVRAHKKPAAEVDSSLDLRLDEVAALDVAGVNRRQDGDKSAQGGQGRGEWGGGCTLPRTVGLWVRGRL
eukprot:6197876-Pleurochrysis_carterae.AAC.1